MNRLQVSHPYYYNMHIHPQVQRELAAAAQKTEDVDAKVGKSALGSLPPLRRVMSLEDKMDSGDIFGTMGVVGIALINLPEDIRDIKAAGHQIKAKWNGEKYIPKYEYSKYQHEFSFLKGTLLHDYMKGIKTQEGKEKVYKIYKADKSLYQTKFGRKICDFLGITNGKSETIPIKNIFGLDATVAEVKAKSAFGELTGRAMKRMTVFGIAALALLELPKIFSSMGKGEDFCEQTGNTVKQTVKSGINVASVIAGIGYGGAFGAKKLGPVGSLIGMGVGAVLGSTISGKIQEAIA